MERVTKLKTYVITYNPALEISQRLIVPYGNHGQANAYARYFYSPRFGDAVSIKVDALTKETAKALFAVHLFGYVMPMDIEGGVDPYIFDGIRNIKSIEEVKCDD